MALFTQVRQVCTVVGDFEATVGRLVRDWGIGPFKCWHFRPPHLYDRTLRGARADWSMKLGITWLGDVQWEVIQPMAGASLYREHLEAKGRGVQHLLMSTGAVSFEEASARLTSHGHGFSQTARISIPVELGPLTLPALPRLLARPASLHFGYIDAEATLRTSIELTRYPLGIPERAVLRLGKAEFCIPEGEGDFERSLPGRRVGGLVKIVIVTRDLEGTARAWRQVAGVGPWHVFDDGQARSTASDRLPQPGLRVAWALVDEVLVELVQPGGDPGPHAEILATRGDGVAALGVTPSDDSVPALADRSVARGEKILRTGPLVGAHPSVLLATRAAIGTDLEVLDPGCPMSELFARTPAARVIA